ncbi:helix-hairpin-helix domain-containing protein [Candidatus Parcubacteria bacterium]|nr:helix-hairpin-helix domain-containing protein [Candidatus Parcubacteria bacterium]
MASTEIQTLELIWENKGRASLLKIARDFRLSNDYCRLICRSLIKNKFIEFSEGQYKITDLGKKELEKLGIIEKVPKSQTLFTKRAGPQGPVKKLARPVKKKVRVKRKKKKVQEKEKGLETKKETIAELSDLGVKLIKTLKKKGFRNLEDIATTSVSRLMQMVEGLGLKKSAQLINKARAKLRKEGKEYLWE